MLKKTKQNNLLTRTQGLGTQWQHTLLQQSGEIYLLSWLSQAGIKPVSYANFFPHLFSPQAHFSTTLLNLGAVFKAQADQKVSVVQTARPVCTHSNGTAYRKQHFLFSIQHSFSDTNRTDGHERSWGNADKMVHIFDRHKKWQDSENVQCLMCDSYIRSEKKRECEKWKKKINNDKIHISVRTRWRSVKSYRQDNIKERIQTLRGDQSKAKKKTILNEERKWKKRKGEKKESQLPPCADSVCTHMPTFHKNRWKVSITGLAFWTCGLLMRRIGGQFCYCLQGYLLIRADWLLFCVPNSFDILSWLPEVPWVGKAAIPLG